MADKKKALYRRLSLRYHPDKPTGNETIMKIINSAERDSVTYEGFKEKLRAELSKNGLYIPEVFEQKKSRIFGQGRPNIFGGEGTPRPGVFYTRKKSEKTETPPQEPQEDIPLLPPAEKSLAPYEKPGPVSKPRFRPDEEEEPGEETPPQPAGLLCSYCGSSNTVVVKPGLVKCNTCGKTQKVGGGGESAISDIVHSSMMTIIISALIGLAIPMIFGSDFGLLGTTMIGVGIIFLGLSKM